MNPCPLADPPRQASEASAPPKPWLAASAVSTLPAAAPGADEQWPAAASSVRPPESLAGGFSFVAQVKPKPPVATQNRYHVFEREIANNGGVFVEENKINSIMDLIRPARIKSEKKRRGKHRSRLV